MAISKFTRTLRKFLPLSECGAVIVAAGSASRMGGIDKVMAELGGEPMIVRTVRAFQKSNVIREIVIVTRSDLIQPIAELCVDFSKVKAIVIGGADRQESVENGLSALSDSVRLAAIQDGARPFVTEEIIDRTVRAAHYFGAAAPGIPVKDTIKSVQGGIVKETPDRSSLRAIQTPQVFDVDIIKGALENAKKNQIAVTDDCSAVEKMGMTVKIVEGDEQNIKVTTPLDLKIAAMLLEEMQ